jgi:hypothetical protein
MLTDFPQDFHIEMSGPWKAWLGVEMCGRFSRLRGMNVLRASLVQVSDAQALLHEYYEAVDVVKRDSDEEIRTYLSGEKAGFWVAYVEEEPAGCVVLRPLLRLRWRRSASVFMCGHRFEARGLRMLCWM